MSTSQNEKKNSFLKDVLFGILILVLPLVILYFLLA